MKYKEVTGASVYQIVYSTNKNNGFKYITVNFKATSKAIKKLKNKKNFCVKVIAYSVIKSTKVK